MRILFRPAAAAEVEEAVGWYEGRQPGLGEDLLEELRRVVGSMDSSPLRFRVVHRDTRMVAT